MNKSVTISVARHCGSVGSALLHHEYLSLMIAATLIEGGRRAGVQRLM